MDLTPKSLIEQDIAQKFTDKPGLAKDINSIFEFNITGANGGTWTLDATEEAGGKITEGSTGTAKCIVTVSDQEFVNIVTKKTNAQMAFMSGKLKVKGDMALALKLTKVLG